MKHIDIPIDRERHAHIKYLLELQGLNLLEVGDQIGVGGSAVSSVSLGRSRSEKIERHLARILGLSVEDLFPERYPQKTTDREDSAMSP